MKFKESYLEFTELTKYFQNFSLLLVRIALAYGFYNPSLIKWSNFETTVSWFTNLGIPFATFSSFMVALVEVVAVLLLLLGFMTRMIAIPLMVIMIVAIFTVHWSNGFSVANNGFEIPLYYLMFLAILASKGAGRFSIDHALFGKAQ